MLNIDIFVPLQVVQLISTEILPFANFIPKEFVGRIMSMLNKGSIHSQSSSFTGTERTILVWLTVFLKQ